jgi:hypothetical protein
VHYARVGDREHYSRAIHVSVLGRWPGVPGAAIPPLAVKRADRDGRRNLLRRIVNSWLRHHRKISALA